MGEFYLKYEYWFAVFQLVMAMVGMGTTLTVKDFREVLLEPKSVTAGSMIQLLAVPLLAFLYILTFGIAGGVAIGIALIAAVPGGSTSNIFTYLAKGNVALSISVTALTTLACLLSTPLILALLIADYMPSDFVMPTTKIMKEIALSLLLPLLAGMTFLHFYPRMAQVFSKWCVRASLFGLLMIFIGAGASGRLDTEAFGGTNILLITGFIVVIAFANRGISKLLNLSQADSTAIDMEVIVRNINLGLMLKASIFPAVLGQADSLADTVLFSLLLYGLLQTLLALAKMQWLRKRGVN